MFKKMVLIALVAALGLAALPTGNVYASGLSDETTPPVRPEPTGERLEKGWQRALRMNERVGKLFERADKGSEKIQRLIDKANQKGLDTAAVQAALDAFAQAIADARVIYDNAQTIIDAHAGFDADGKVSDAAEAAETLKSVGEQLKALRETVSPSGKALREAIKAFREANPRPVKPTDSAPAFAPSAGS
ncbi:MAG: hypothetical protein L3J16_07730 [Anaerolineales bacterium]|nr:hypothetical protein [Anaerolineales bacterium]